MSEAVPKVMKADHWFVTNRPKPWKQFLKKMKARRERRRAKKNPECMVSYGKYRGWNS